MSASCQSVVIGQDSAAVANNRFAAAQDRFLALIPQEEHGIFKTCKNRRHLLQHIEVETSLGKWKSESAAKALVGIFRFSRSVESYFKVVEIFVQSNPKYTAIFWGSFRLVLQLASNFATFFEKVAALLENIERLFPQYEDILDTLRKEFDYGKNDHDADVSYKGTNLKLAENALCDIYVDMFELFRRVCHIFTGKDGTPRFRPAVYAHLAFKPFDATFSDLSARFAENKTLLNVTISSNHFEEASKARVKQEIFRRGTDATLQQQSELAENEKRRAMIEQVQTWLASPDFKELLETSQELLLQGTAAWLSEVPNYKSWRDSVFTTNQTTLEDVVMDSVTTDHMFWVSGKPGSGKTITAAYTITELQQTYLHDHVYYYFFSQISPRHPNIASAAYRAIAFQLLQRHRQDAAVVDRFLFAMFHQAAGPHASKSELLDLLKLSCENSGPCFIVLDGVDECSTPETLLKELAHLTSGTLVRVLIFSRPNVHWLRKNILKVRHQPVSFECNRDDIGKYVQHRVAELVAEEFLPSGVDVSVITERLVRGSNGMFLWARLMFTYLECPALTSRQRMKTISEVELLEGLDAVYERILGLIHRSPVVQRQLARRLFQWLTYAKQRLDNTELREALTSPEELRYGDYKLDEFDNAVVLSCGGLVEADAQAPRGQNSPHSATFYQFIHLSVKEYLSNIADQLPPPNSTFSAFYGISKQAANLEICLTCLRYLLDCTPAQPLSGRLGVRAKSTELEIAFPFLKHASSFWIEHLIECSFLDCQDNRNSALPDTNMQKDVLQAASKLLGSDLSLMAWIESLYTFTTAYETFQNQRKWAMHTLNLSSEHSHFIMQHESLREVATRMLEFSQDLLKIHSEWKNTLSNNPHEIWGDVTAFTPSRFLRPTKAVSAQSLSPTAPTSKMVNDSYLCTISQHSSDGSELGILSIWPSRSFVDKKRNPSSEKWCSNWRIKYEIRDLRDSSKRKCNFSVVMDKGDLILQFGKDPDISRIHFPCCIANDLNTFIVLRKLFILQRPTESKLAKLTTLDVPAQDNLSTQTLGSRTQIQDYSHKLSPRGNFILSRHRTAMAIYEVINLHKEKPCYLKQLGSSPNSIVRDLFCFHPNLPLAAFAEESAIKIWIISTKRYPSTFRSGFQIGLLMKSLSFSSSGTHLVISDWDSDCPDVMNLDTLKEYREVRVYTKNEEEKQQLSKQGLQCTNSSGLFLEGALATSSKTTPRTSIIPYLKLRDDDNQITLSALGNGKGSENIQLLNTPNWLKGRDVSVSLPRVAEDDVHIVFNAVAEPWYHLKEREEEPERRRDRVEKALPIFVRKDTRAIEVPSSSSASQLLPWTTTTGSLLKEG